MLEIIKMAGEGQTVLERLKIAGNGLTFWNG